MIGPCPGPERAGILPLRGLKFCLQKLSQSLSALPSQCLRGRKVEPLWPHGAQGSYATPSRHWEGARPPVFSVGCGEGSRARGPVPRAGFPPCGQERREWRAPAASSWGASWLAHFP